MDFNYFERVSKMITRFMMILLSSVQDFKTVSGISMICVRFRAPHPTLLGGGGVMGGELNSRSYLMARRAGDVDRRLIYIFVQCMRLMHSYIHDALSLQFGIVP